MENKNISETLNLILTLTYVWVKSILLKIDARKKSLNSTGMQKKVLSDIAEIIKKVSGSSSTITTHKAEDGLFVLDENKAREMGFRSSDPQKIVKRYIEGLIK